VDKVGGDLMAARRRIGAYALRSETAPLATRLATVAARLPQPHWPAAVLRVVAVDTLSGDYQVFDRDSGVELVDAIAASCAVPGAWPPVPIGTRIFMDGGIRSFSNADIAQGAGRVLVIAPLGWADGNPVSGHLRAEAEVLRASGSRVCVIVPDEASAEAMGDNVLDPARCALSAQAGLGQGLHSAAWLDPVWNS
jgi:NTE family protein